MDVVIACVDGLTGFPEAINTGFPQTKIQLCIIHQIRNSLKDVSYKDRNWIAFLKNGILSILLLVKAGIEIGKISSLYLIILMRYGK